MSTAIHYSLLDPEPADGGHIELQLKSGGSHSRLHIQYDVSKGFELKVAIPGRITLVLYVEPESHADANPSPASESPLPIMLRVGSSPSSPPATPTEQEDSSLEEPKETSAVTTLDESRGDGGEREGLRGALSL